MSETVLVSPNLVRYVRRGVRSQLGFAAQRLATCLLELDDDPIDEYERSLHVFQVAHTLYDQIKAAGDQPPSGIAIDVAPNARLVLRALECQYNTELDRLQEAEFYGVYKETVDKDVRELGDLVREIKSHIEQTGLDRAEPFPKPPTP